jgi:hypothetical protein
MRTVRPLLLVVLAASLVGGCGGKGDPQGRTTVVLVTVDTLRRDFVAAYTPTGREARAATPRMDALAADGVRFADARTPVPLTLPAHTTMMSGLPPAAHGVRSNSASRLPPRDARRFPMLAETLRDAGWCCGAFVSAGPLVERFGLSAGFDAYDDGALDDFTAGAYQQRPGVATVGRALAWLDGLRTGQRAFLWVHVFEPHEPYAPDYRTDVEAADAVVGLLVDGLAARGRGDAAVVLASDHGEALGELLEPTHGFLLGEGVLRVPLVVHAPGLPPAVRRDPADLADVAPTLAGLAGVPFPIPDVPVGGGLDLLRAAAPPDRARVAEGLHAWHQHRWAQLTAAVVGAWKLEDRGEAADRPRRLFRLTEEAPGQDDGVAAESRPEATASANALRAYVQAESSRVDAGGAAAGNYGAGGPVGRVLDPVANGRRPDPYAVITDDARLNQAAAAITATPVAPARLEGARKALATLEGRGADDPSIAFWKGRLLRLEGKHALARAAFARALDLGRWDAESLLLAGRSAFALDDADGVLALIAAWRDRTGDDPRLADLEAEAWGRKGEGTRQGAATARAQALRATRRATVETGGCR